MAQELRADAKSLRDAVAKVVADEIGAEPGDINVMIQARDFDDDRSVHLSVEFAGEGPEEEPDSEPDAPPADLDAELDEEAEVAADFVEEMLDILELPGDLKIRLFDEHAEIEVVETDAGVLIGRGGATLDAIQELLRCSLQQELQRRTRVKVDVEGYRAERLGELEAEARRAIDDALDSGESTRLEPMDVFDRKAIHNLVSGEDGVTSRSQGREPARRVVIEPE